MPSFVITWALVGGLGAGILLFLGHQQSSRWQRRSWSRGLWIAALIYVLFVVVGPGGKGPWLTIESLGVLVYGIFAWRGQRSSLWLAAGWALHVVWDIVLHGGLGAHWAAEEWSLGEITFVPGWYPPACLGFDLAVASYLLWRSRQDVSAAVADPRQLASTKEYNDSGRTKDHHG